MTEGGITGTSDHAINKGLEHDRIRLTYNRDKHAGENKKLEHDDVVSQTSSCSVTGPDLERFLEAQAPVWPDVLGELREGRKRTHWMWFVFPQLRGLGHSTTAMFFGIADRGEASAYLDHAVLGTRLVQATRLVLASDATDAVAIFGAIDAMKFRSSMTLFATVAGELIVFADALRRFHHGEADAATLHLLGAG